MKMIIGKWYVSVKGINNNTGTIKVRVTVKYKRKLHNLTDKQKALLTKLSYIDYSTEKIKKCTMLSDLVNALEDANNPYLGILGESIGIHTTPKELINQVIDSGLGDLKLVKTMKKDSGFFAIAFEDYVGNVGFSFRGTETKKIFEFLNDVNTDVVTFINQGSASEQIDDAKKFYISYRTLAASNFLYGHSLGGNLVENVYAGDYKNIYEAFLINPLHMNKSNLNNSQKNAFYDMKKFKCYIIEGDWVSGLISANCKQYEVVSNRIKLDVTPKIGSHGAIISQIYPNMRLSEEIIWRAYCHTIEAASYNKNEKFLLKI